jgi:hypothetical protein
LFLAAVVAAYIALKTLKAIEHEAKEIKDVADAAKDNADAALLNAQAIIASERPWFVVSIEPIEGTHPRVFRVQAFNAGRTPGRLEDGHCVCETHSANHKFSEKLNDPFYRPKQDLVVNRDSFSIREIDPESCINQRDREGEGMDPQVLFVYGQLRYWDVFTIRNDLAAAPYETWWCFRYDPATKTFSRAANGYAKNT